MARRRKTRRSGGMLRQKPAQTTPMADKGRREDDEVAHVAEGEVVLPANVRTPEFMQNVRQHFEQMGVPLDRYTVQDTDADQHAARFFSGQQGGQQGMLPANPATGRPEYFSAGDVGNNAGRGGSDNGGGSGGVGNSGGGDRGGGPRGGVGPSASGGVSPGGGNTGGRAGPTGNEATGPGDVGGAAPTAGNSGVAGNLGMNPRSTGTASMSSAAQQMSHQAAHEMSTHSGLGAPETARQMAEDALTSMRRGTRMAPATERGMIDLGIGAALGLGSMPTPTPGMMRGFAKFAGNNITSGLESLTGTTAANPPGSVGDNTGLAEGLSAEGGDADAARRAALIEQNGPAPDAPVQYGYRGMGEGGYGGSGKPGYSGGGQPGYGEGQPGGNLLRTSKGQVVVEGEGGDGLLPSDEAGLLAQKGGGVLNKQTGGQQFYAGKSKRRGMMPQRNPETRAQEFYDSVEEWSAVQDASFAAKQAGDLASRNAALNHGSDLDANLASRDDGASFAEQSAAKHLSSAPKGTEAAPGGARAWARNTASSATASPASMDRRFDVYDAAQQNGMNVDEFKRQNPGHPAVKSNILANQQQDDYNAAFDLLYGRGAGSANAGGSNRGGFGGLRPHGGVDGAQGPGGVSGNSRGTTSASSNTNAQASPELDESARADEVRRLYDELFGREPDQAGLDYWRSHQGDDLRGAMLRSAAPTDRTGHVTNMYDDVLDRTPDQPGRNYWTGEGWDQAVGPDGVLRDDFTNAAGPEAISDGVVDPTGAGQDQPLPRQLGPVNTGRSGSSRADLGNTSRLRQPREYESLDLSELYADTFPWWNEQTGAQEFYAGKGNRRGMLNDPSMNPGTGAQEFNAADLGNTGGGSGGTPAWRQNLLDAATDTTTAYDTGEQLSGIKLDTGGFLSTDQINSLSQDQIAAGGEGLNEIMNRSRQTEPPQQTSPSNTNATFTSPNLNTQSNTSENDSVENRLDSLLQSSNPLMEKAGGRARQQANRRGLLNSSMATQAGQSAMVDAALPIAQQDAQTAAQKNLADQQYRQDRAMLGAEYQNRSALTDQQFGNQMELQQAQDAAAKERLGMQLSSEEQRLADELASREQLQQQEYDYREQFLERELQNRARLQYAKDAAAKDRLGMQLSSDERMALNELQSAEDLLDAELGSREAMQAQSLNVERELNQLDADTRLQLGELDANVRRDIANLQVSDNERQSAIKAGIDVQNMYQNAFNTISQNPNIPADVRESYLDHIMAVQDRNLGMIEDFYNVDLDWGDTGNGGTDQAA